MKNEDVVLLHRLWLNITREPGLENLHHHDILAEALTRLENDYSAAGHEDIVRDLRRNADAGPMPARRIADQVHTVQSEPSRNDGDVKHGDEASSNPEANSPK